MADVLFIAITVAFFLLCVIYVQLCDRIIGSDDIDDTATPDEPSTALEPSTENKEVAA